MLAISLVVSAAIIVAATSVIHNSRTVIMNGVEVNVKAYGLPNGFSAKVFYVEPAGKGYRVIAEIGLYHPIVRLLSCLESPGYIAAQVFRLGDGIMLQPKPRVVFLSKDNYSRVAIFRYSRQSCC